MSKNKPAEFADSGDSPLLSIVIVNWNTREALRNCLASLFEQSRSLTLEVIVVDNASADDSLDMLKAGFPQVRIIANTINLGFARACNQGMRAARGRLLLLLNSDTYVRDDVIARMTAYLLSRPDVAMAGCQLQYPDGRIQHTAFRSLSILRNLFEDLWLYKLLPSVRGAVYALLTRFSPNVYYRSQRQMYGWQSGFYLRAFGEIYGNSPSRSLKSEEDSPTFS